ncbi:hypothetical protein D9613_011382 [Agrocybe pediades]|uniref:Uncharacterized protein n=1 Tax=Agrocybe pediades TaxID=84607 RepID=A0A8H4VPU7_9AGAR|nr:hypothetical protein D9613_011382 [Agrocybe pediades]
MEDVGTPFIIGLLPGLFTTTDVALFINTKHEFIASLFNEPDNVPVDMKWSWLGSTMMQNPDVCKAVLTRVQDPQKFLEAAADGLPLLVVNGTRDTHSKGEVLVKKLEPLFKDLEVCTIQGGSHSMFYDNKVEFIQAVTSFANRVARKP